MSLRCAALCTLLASSAARLVEQSSFDLLSSRPPSEVMSGWELLGDAALIDDFVRLTGDAQHKSGALVARHHLSLSAGGAWAADLTFRVGGVGATLFGDGIGFWYTQSPVRLGGMLGGETRFAGLFLGLDTYINSADAAVHPHPYLGAAVSDGSELASHDAAGLHTSFHAPAGCPMTTARQVSDKEPRVATLRVEFSARTLTVKYMYGSGPTDYRYAADAAWTHCLTISDVDLPQGYYWGATAATGDVTDNHDVFGIVAYDGAVDPPQAGQPPGRPASEFDYKPFQPTPPRLATQAEAPPPAAGPSIVYQTVQPTMQRE